jgi:hypothetical protein
MILEHGENNLDFLCIHATNYVLSRDSGKPPKIKLKLCAPTEFENPLFAFVQLFGMLFGSDVSVSMIQCVLVSQLFYT